VKRIINIDELYEGIRKGDRVMLGRGITLVESALPSDAELAAELLNRCFPFSGNSIRIGITGAPGAGKSTFIGAIGSYLTSKNNSQLSIVNCQLKVAVLAIDPSSERSHGSILGDKTRMDSLANAHNAFVRPSPSVGAKGGVGRKTREAVMLCEAAGYEVIFIETVGVGQSEITVHSLVDFFLLLLLPGAGDELQGIKRGIMEMADAVVITKADGDNITAANRALGDYTNALHTFPPPPIRLDSESVFVFFPK